MNNALPLSKGDININKPLQPENTENYWKYDLLMLNKLKYFSDSKTVIIYS